MNTTDLNSINIIQQALTHFQPITLAEMQHVALLDRMDTKYVMGVSQLYQVLHQMSDQYRVLDIHQLRLNHYLTLYFDTPDFQLYHDHHNGSGDRYKVRARKYLNSDLAFLEVKHKTNQHRTIKSRIQTPDLLDCLEGQATEFIDRHTPYHPDQLEPKVWNEYHRMTFVSTRRQERVTIDLNVAFYWGETMTMLPGVVIAEVKQGRFSQDSDFIQHMRRLSLRPTAFSKYTAGVYSLYEQVKSNNFKAQMREINQIMQEEYAHESLH